MLYETSYKVAMYKDKLVGSIETFTFIKNIIYFFKIIITLPP